MQSQHLFLSNLPGMAWSLVSAALYTGSTLAVGAWIAPPVPPGWEGMCVAVRYALGAAVYGLLFALLAMSGVAYPAAVLALALLPAALGLRRWLKAQGSIPPPALAQMLRVEFRLAHCLAAAGIVALLAYPLGLSLAWVRGGDMAIYHLVIPRSVLWNHGLVFNPFSHDAGLYYGWQLYALPAYLMGGERAFQLCSFVALLVFALATHRVFLARYGVLAGLTGALVVVATACGMGRESVVNNDIPLALLQVTLLGLAATAAPRRHAAVVLGLLAGFAVAVKLVAAATAGLACALFLWRASRPTRAGVAAALAAAALVSLAPWPLFDYVSSGSPLPHFLLVWPPDSGYLPQYRESMATLMQYFGEWYRKNFFGLFSHGLAFVPALMAGYLVLPFVKAAREDRFVRTLAACALLNAALLIALNRFDAALIFHDRYHLASYLMLALGGLLCWVHAARLAPAGWVRPGTAAFLALALVGVVHLYRAPVPAILVMGGGRPDYVAALPSLAQGLSSALERMDEGPGGGRGGVGYDVAARMLPPKAVVATTVIDPYLLQRPFLQMLPVSENLIDLSLPPEALRRALIEHGATHLHLSQHSGLNPWMVPTIDRWLASLRLIPQLQGVRRLLFLNYPTQKGTQAFYVLNAPLGSGHGVLHPLANVRLTRDPDGTWVVRWEPGPAGDVRVDLREADGRVRPLGEAAREIGQFPIRLRLPGGSRLQVMLFAGDRTEQRLELAVPSG